MGLVFDISPSPSIFTLLRWLPLCVCAVAAAWWLADLKQAVCATPSPDRPFVSRQPCFADCILLHWPSIRSFWKSCYAASWSRVVWTKALGLSGCN